MYFFIFLYFDYKMSFANNNNNDCDSLSTEYTDPSILTEEYRFKYALAQNDASVLSSLTDINYNEPICSVSEIRITPLEYTLKYNGNPTVLRQVLQKSFANLQDISQDVWQRIFNDRPSLEKLVLIVVRTAKLRQLRELERKGLPDPSVYLRKRFCEVLENLNMKTLVLDQLPIGDQEANALFKNRHVINLDIRYTNITDLGISTLRLNKHIKNLIVDPQPPQAQSEIQQGQQGQQFQPQSNAQSHSTYQQFASEYRKNQQRQDQPQAASQSYSTYQQFPSEYRRSQQD
jgi:hypothetical protein